MEILKGIPVSRGVAISPAYVLGRQHYVIPIDTVASEDARDEVERLRLAISRAADNIRKLSVSLRGTLAEKYSAIFDAHLAILTDRRLFNEIASHINNDGFSAAHAASRVLGEYARALESVDDAYLSERSRDIFDIQQRLLSELTGPPEAPLDTLTSPVALVAHDLTPSETIALDRGKVTGFATDAGGSTSHTAILAKALSLPAVVGLATATVAVAPGDTVIIDGNKGLLVVNPDEATLERYRSSVTDIRLAEDSLVALRDLPAETTDGRLVRLMGNIELPEEVDTAVRNGALGIGLFRTEFLYLQAGHEPTEDEQFHAYLHAARAMAGKPLVIRTFDLGGDKFATSMKHPFGRNPSLGCRSIRYSFENPEMFITQLRAILRVAVHGNVRLLLPMISNLGEVRRAKGFLDQARMVLASEAIPAAPDLPVGIMVEVPSVAIAPDIFAGEVDFFSIGTNDLVQYSLAVERVNEHVAPLFTPAHPAILRLLKNVVETSARLDIPVSICGEISADPLFSMLLVGLGFEELSLNPPAIPRLKRAIRSFSFSDAREVAAKAFQMADAADVRAFLLKSLPEAARHLIA